MPELIRLAMAAMGTRFELVLAGGAAPRLRALGEEALEEIRHWHDRLSWFDPGSFVSHLNAEAGRRAVECDGEIFELLVLCREVWRASGGAFDPTVAGLMRAGGFRDLARDEAAIARARASTGFDKVELDAARRTVRFSGPGVGIDLGAIGKGWALDRAARVLREGGVVSAILHGGTSSVIGIGAPEGEAGWGVKVGPGDGDPVVVLRDLALGVSEPSGRVVTEGSERHGHVLDPRTGRSVSGARAAAVVGASAALADAWSTALLVEQARPAGMPGGLVSMIGPANQGGDWRIDGPGAATLIRS